MFPSRWRLSRETRDATTELRKIGFYLGLASLALHELGLMPLSAVICSGIGLSTFNEKTEKNQWMAGALYWACRTSL